MDFFNGVIYVRSYGSFVMHTDACTKGARMFLAGNWWYLNWEKGFPEAKDLINNKEILAVTSAVECWAPNWINCDVLVCTDSSITKTVINKGTCRNELV